MSGWGIDPQRFSGGRHVLRCIASRHLLPNALRQFESCPLQDVEFRAAACGRFIRPADSLLPIRAAGTDGLALPNSVPKQNSLCKANFALRTFEAFRGYNRPAQLERSAVEGSMKIDIQRFRVPQAAGVDLARWPTRVDPVHKSKKHYKQLLEKHVDQLAERQRIFYAHDRYSLLLIFQAMDAAGKDGAIKHVMSGVNPQGCQVFSFKHPSVEELDHDFLWRTTRCLPERGRIGVFNRSYYEEVLIVRVHPEILRAQKLPDEVLQDERLWESRYRSIRGLEAHLHANGTHIVKFFLHLSKDEQRRRFLARIDDPDKNWKFSRADLRERELWPEYQKAYAACLSATSTADAPWYVVPADDKENARLIISQIILDTFDGFKMSYPAPDDDRRKELQDIRELLAD